MARADLTAQARRTYVSRVRVYLAWLAETDVDGDPLADPVAAAWAARDYKSHLYGTPRRALATVNGALAAVSDLAIRRGLGQARRRPGRPAGPAGPPGPEGARRPR